MWTFLKIALQFLSRDLWKAIAAGFTNLMQWLGKNPAFVQFLLFAGFCAMTYLTFQQRAYKRKYSRELATQLVQNDSLSAVIARLSADRERAYDYADSLTQNSYATKDSIRNQVARMPPAVRTQLNRKLLSDLGL